MSELKAKLAYTLDEIEVVCSHAEGAEYYLKSDADKVIADLKDKLQKESALLKETREWLIESQKMHKRCADNAARIIRCSSHKRCLDKAERCEWERRFWTNSVLAGKGQMQFAHWAEKWRKIWLALAEEPTWAKFLQLIRKEAK